MDSLMPLLYSTQHALHARAHTHAHAHAHMHTIKTNSTDVRKHAISSHISWNLLYALCLQTACTRAHTHTQQSIRTHNTSTTPHTHTQHISHICRYSTLDEAQLASFGVYDSTHRQKILSKIAGSEDFDNMLGDLDSVIKDLEMFTVVSNAHVKSTRGIGARRVGGNCNVNVNVCSPVWPILYRRFSSVWLSALWLTYILAALLS